MLTGISLMNKEFVSHLIPLVLNNLLPIMYIPALLISVYVVHTAEQSVLSFFKEYFADFNSKYLIFSISPSLFTKPSSLSYTLC